MKHHDTENTQMPPLQAETQWNHPIHEKANTEELDLRNLWESWWKWNSLKWLQSAAEICTPGLQNAHLCVLMFDVLPPRRTMSLFHAPQCRAMMLRGINRSALSLWEWWKKNVQNQTCSCICIQVIPAIAGFLSAFSRASQQISQIQLAHSNSWLAESTFDRAGHVFETRKGKNGGVHSKVAVADVRTIGRAGFGKALCGFCGTRVVVIWFVITLQFSLGREDFFFSSSSSSFSDATSFEILFRQTSTHPFL